MLLTVVMFNHRNISEVKQWFSKWGPRPPGGPGAECRGSAIIQSNIGGPCTFKEKMENNRILFGDIEKGPIVEIA